MSARARVIVAVVWVMSLAGVAAIAQPRLDGPQAPKPGIVFSGANLGFRVKSTDNGAIVGTVVVRVNNEWVPVEHAGKPQVRPLITKR